MFNGVKDGVVLKTLVSKEILSEYTILNKIVIF